MERGTCKMNYLNILFIASQKVGAIATHKLNRKQARAWPYVEIIEKKWCCVMYANFMPLTVAAENENACHSATYWLGMRITTTTQRWGAGLPTVEVRQISYEYEFPGKLRCYDSLTRLLQLRPWWDLKFIQLNGISCKRCLLRRVVPDLNRFPSNLILNYFLKNQFYSVGYNNIDLEMN